MNFTLVLDGIEMIEKIEETQKVLPEDSFMAISSSEEIMDGSLNGQDAVIFPGGLSAWYGLRKYGEQFAHAVRYFVVAGGGYLGICGGAYIAGRAPAKFVIPFCNRCLKLADIRISNPPLISTIGMYEATKQTLCPEFVDIANVSHPIIDGHQGELLETMYSAGPTMLDPGNTIIPLAYFHEPEWGGTIAIIATTFGYGRVVLCSPHPESEWNGLPIPWLYPNMAKWVAEREIGPFYPIFPWEKPSWLPSAVPVAMGLAGLSMGVIIAKRKWAKIK